MLNHSKPFIQQFHDSEMFKDSAYKNHPETLSTWKLVSEMQHKAFLPNFKVSIKGKELDLLTDYQILKVCSLELVITNISNKH
jgi:hypothetical protein